MKQVEIRTAIEITKQEIYEIMQQIEGTHDSKEKHVLEKRLKEIQYLQLWHIDQLQALDMTVR